MSSRYVGRPYLILESCTRKRDKRYDAGFAEVKLMSKKSLAKTAPAMIWSMQWVMTHRVTNRCAATENHVGRKEDRTLHVLSLCPLTSTKKRGRGVFLEGRREPLTRHPRTRYRHHLQNHLRYR